MSKNKIKVAFLFGGRSPEHEISIISGLQALEACDPERYETIPVYIAQTGRWYTGKELLDKKIYPRFKDYLSKLTEVTLLPTPGAAGLSVINQTKGFSLFGKTQAESIPVDVFYPCFHGQFGEDGCIQGLFELASVAYTGCNVLASALAMNKYLCKVCLHAHGIPVLPAVVVKREDAQRDLSSTRQMLRSTPGLENFPLFVKPVNLGSSIAVSKAEDEAGLDAALAQVFQYDVEAIIEPCITKLLEINVSVRDSDGIITSVTETPVPNKDVLTFEDKYLRPGGKKSGPDAGAGMASLTRVIDPPDLDPALKAQVCGYGREAYHVLGLGGPVRFDFMLDLSSGQLYFNELNPLPGSLAFYLWEKSKPQLLFTELVHDTIQQAIKRREQRAGLRRDLGFRAIKA